MFASDRGFWGRAISNGVSQILQRLTLVVTATKFWDKIGYNSAYIRDIPDIFAYNRGFQAQAIE